jgi:hypothetical protein
MCFNRKIENDFFVFTPTFSPSFSLTQISIQHRPISNLPEKRLPTNSRNIFA